MDWFVDDIHFSTKTHDQWHTLNIKGGGFDAPFDRPFHVILNLAVGGKMARGRE